MLSGAIVIKINNEDIKPCSDVNVGPPGVNGLKYDGYSLSPGPKIKHFDTGQTVTYRFTIVWENGVDKPVNPSVTVKLLNNGEEVNSITINDNPNKPFSSSYHTMDYTYEEDGKYIVTLKWYDADGEEKYGSGIWKSLATYVGDVDISKINNKQLQIHFLFLRFLD